MLAVAVALLLAGGLRDLTAPWEDGLRGDCAAIYEDVFVRNFLQYGLAVTHAAPAFVCEVDGAPVCTWYWHHPPLYPLYLAGVAAVLGQHEWSLRLAHLLLFVPAVAMLFLLLRRAIAPLAAAFAALLFATTPLVGYFGPTVVHDGAVLTFGLATAAAYWRHVHARSRTSFAATAALFFVATQLDFLGHLWLAALLALALVAEPRRRALTAVAALVPVALLSLLAVSLHYAQFLGGPLSLLAGIAQFAAETVARAPSAGEIAAATEGVLVDAAAWPICGFAALGVALAARGGPADRRAAGIGLALLLPGLLGCLISPRHFVDHAFWAMPMMAGIATLAALPLVFAHRALGEPRAVRRTAAVGLLALGVACVGHGAATTQALIVRHRPVDASFPTMVAEAREALVGCTVVLTNRPVPMRSYLPGLPFVGGIGTADQLEACLRYGREQGIRGEVAFVLDPLRADAGLVARLTALAPPQHLRHATVHRFRQ